MSRSRKKNCPAARGPNVSLVFNMYGRAAKIAKRDVSSTGIEPVTFRYMIFQLQPNVIANYTTRRFSQWGCEPTLLVGQELPSFA